MAEMLPVRTNGIAPTKQAEIEAAYAAIDPTEIGDRFNAPYLRNMMAEYLRFGTYRSDEDFLSVFATNFNDITATERAVRRSATRLAGEAAHG